MQVDKLILQVGGKMQVKIAGYGVKCRSINFIMQGNFAGCRVILQVVFFKFFFY